MHDNYIKKITFMFTVTILVSSCFVLQIHAEFTPQTSYYEQQVSLSLSPNNFIIPEKSIIITPNLFYEAAKKLAEYHTNQGVPTRIITTEWIIENYNMAPDPPYRGYVTNLSTKLTLWLHYKDLYPTAVWHDSIKKS